MTMKFKFRRSQWYTVTRPFNTIVFSYTQKQALKNTSLGLNIINDIAGDSRFSTDGVYLALANNIKINEDNLSLGIQGSMFQKSLKYDELFFLEEESFYNNTISFFDMNIGAAFMTNNFIASASIYHLNKPNQTFSSTNQEKLEHKHVIYFSYIEPYNSKLILYPELYYFQQQENRSFVLGTNISYKINNTDLKLGVYNRYGDAFFVNLGIIKDNLELLLSYDVNTSSLYAASNRVGAFEFSITYGWNKKKLLDPKKNSLSKIYIMRAKYLFCFLLLPLSLLSQSTISIHKIDTNICTEDSEVNFLQVNDTAAYFTRILNNQNNYTTKVYKSTFTNGKWGHSKPSKLNHYINNPSNIFFTEDRIYVCGFLENYKKPSIFYSEIKDSSQYNFIKVFNNNFFNSQPIVVSTKNYKVMYFVSDMPGGFGGLDIWLTIIDHDGNFGVPINAGKQINTKYDEVTPYYQTKNNQLYFSSNKSKGQGGFDIYSSQGSLNKWKSPVNVKQLNSIFDELYFNYYNDTVGYFSSNRKTEDMKGLLQRHIYL